MLATEKVFTFNKAGDLHQLLFFWLYGKYILDEQYRDAVRIHNFFFEHLNICGENASFYFKSI